MVSAAPERALGKFERLCWERQERDLALAYPDGIPKNPRETKHPKGYWFDQKLGEHAVQFVEKYCRHSKGKWAGQLIVLEVWQRRLILIAFGWRRPDDTRRFRILYVEIPRKNAKSTTAAALGLYLLAGDQEPGAEIYSSATKKDQAKIVHDAATAMVKKSPELKRWIKPYRNNLSCERLASKFEPLGADSNTLDGLNPHGNIVDELHAHKDRGVWDVLDTAMGAREQPMTIAITTAGVYAPESIGWLMHQHACSVLEGVLDEDEPFEDDAFLAFIAAADEEDDWTDPATWAKANPNIGVSVREDYLAEQCEKAKKQPSFLNTFLRLHLNRWTEQQERWISPDAWRACDSRPIDLAALAGRRCYFGLDLSTKLDLTALAMLFEPIPTDDLWTLVMRYWCPADTILERSKRDRVPYDAWTRDGWITKTPGNVTDYDFIEDEVEKMYKHVDLVQLGYDPWNASQVATHLMGIVGRDAKGEERIVEVRQGYKSLSEASKEFEALVVSKRVRNGGNPVLRWNVANASIRKDPNENIAPDKSTSTGRIDGLVAAIIALSRAIVNPGEAKSVYETRGVRTFG